MTIFFLTPPLFFQRTEPRSGERRRKPRCCFRSRWAVYPNKFFYPRAQSHIYLRPTQSRSKVSGTSFNMSPNDFLPTQSNTSSPSWFSYISLSFDPLENIEWNFFCYQHDFSIFQLVKNTLFAIIGTKKIMLCSQFVYFNKMKTSYSQHVCYQHYAPLGFFKHNSISYFCFNKKTKMNFWKHALLISFGMPNWHGFQQLQHLHCDMCNRNTKCFQRGCSK